MSDAPVSIRALGGRYLMLLGIAGVAIAVYLTVTGLLDLANGSFFPRSSGGLPQVGFGVLFGATAIIWLGLRGLPVHRKG